MPLFIVLGLVVCGLLLLAIFRLRRQLRATLETFDVLATRAPVGILQADPHGRCTFANEAWCALSGMSLDDTLGRAWSQAVHPDDLPGTMAEWEASVREQRPYAHELRLLRPDGSERHVLARACPIHDPQGRVSGFIGTVLDVTDRHAAVRLLRGLIEAQETQKRVLCHEFHDGLIQYAVGSKMLLESLREGGLPTATSDVVESVIECLAKGIEDGRRVIRGIRPAALDDLGLRAAIHDLADEVRENGVGIELTLDAALDELPPPLQTTAYRVVQESLNNARRHSGATSLRVTVSRAAATVNLMVEDFGSGFDVTEVGQQGLGLPGLAERVRLVGGLCDVESEPGRGTKVTVRLPLGEDSAVAD